MRITGRLFGEDDTVLADRNFQLVLLPAILAPLSAALISPILDPLTVVFDVSPARIGLLVAAVTAPGIVVIPLMGVVADRYGRKKILVAGTMLYGVAGLAVSTTTNFEVALAIRFLQGVGLSGMLPMIITTIGDLYSGSREATAQGIRLTIVGISLVVFPVIAGSIVALAWYYPFAMYGLAIPVAIALFLLLDEPSDLDDEPSGGIDPGKSNQGLVELVSDGRVLAVLVGRTVPSFLWFGFLTYNSTIVVRLLSGTPQDAGLLVALGSLTFAGAASQSGRITNAFESSFYPLVGIHVCQTAGFVLLAFASSLAVGMVGVVFVGAGFGVSSSIYRTVITGLASTDTRGGLVSLGESLGKGGATLAPVSMGALIGVTTPVVGSIPAIQWTMTAAGAGGGLVGVICVVAARSVLPVE